MYTANTMSSAIEAMGMSLPYSSSTPAEDPLKLDECVRAGAAILRLLELFRESKVHFAVIVDEHGSIEGVVTPVDILTAIAGELDLERSGTYEDGRKVAPFLE